MAPTSLSIVASAESLSAEWLTEVLVGSGAAEPGSRVLDLALERIGEGKIGCNLRCSLTFEPAGAGPATVVVKLPSDDAGSRATGVSLGLYEREVRFYRDLAGKVGCRVPHCHAALFDGATGDYTLVLEDLAGARTGDQLAGCTPGEARAAVDALARLHASFWDRPVPAWLPPGMAQSAEGVGQLYGALVPGFVDHYRDALPPEVLDLLGAFAERFAEWGRRAAAGPLSVVHGDFRLDNLLFEVDGEPAVAAVDWQTVAHGSPAADLAYFIGAGLVPETRRALETELVERYLNEIESLGVTVPDRDEFEDCYAANTLAGLIMAVLPAMMVGESERSRALFGVMAERHARHAIDKGALS
ncbi:MAG TPA: phosphotransferase [Acidimicrobiales bacterium]|nr:phosphotransferase [Acidimicrobiales bacterium]